jgi:HEAT repeat protein
MNIARLLILPVLVASISFAEETVDGIIKELPVPNAEKRDEVFGKLIKLGKPAITELCKKLVDPGKGNDLAARYALHGLAIHVQRKGGEAERAQFAKAMAAELPGEYTKPVKGFIIRQLHHAGDTGSVPAIATSLLDAELGEYAAQALLSIGGKEATKSLRDALPKSVGPARMTLIQALGAMRDEASAGEIAKSVSDQNREMRIVAMNALANIGHAESASLIAEKAKVEARYEANKATDAYLLLIRRLEEAGKTAEAGVMYKDLFDGKVGKGEAQIQCAALLGLSKTQGDKALDLIFQALNSKNFQLRSVASRAALESKGKNVTQWWLSKLTNSKPEAKANILNILAKRGDRLALAAALSEMRSENAALRKAALNVVVTLGDETTVPPLVAFLSSKKDEERRAAQEAMVRISNAKAIAAMADSMTKSKGMAKAGLIDILTRKGAVAQLDPIINAITDEDIGVRTAAWNAVKSMGNDALFPRLLKLHAESKGGTEQNNAQRALREVYARAGDKNKNTDEIVQAMNGASEATTASLLYVLKRVGNAKGLAETRKHLKSDKKAVVDSAVRAIAEWPNADALNDQITIAESSADLAHQVLSLRGYDRLLRASKLKPVDQLNYYERGFKAAKRPQEKGLMISGMGSIASLETLKVLQPYAIDKEHSGVAVAAVKLVALEVFKTNPSGAKAGVAAIRATSKDEAVSKKLDEVIAEIEKREDHITEWLVSEKYTRRDKKLKDLFDQKFPPEARKPKKPAVWKFVSTAKTAHPWYADLHDYGGGNDSVMYLQTFVRSSSDADARLELGYDDTLKVWLNGKQVFADPKPHRYATAQEIAEVKLTAGWNELLLKSINGTANWEASARIRKSDGSQFDGLIFAGGKDYLAALEKDVADETMGGGALKVAMKLIPVLKTGKGDNVKEFLGKLLEATKDPEAIKAITSAFDEIDKYGGYISDWMVSGNYRKDGKDGVGLFDIVFPPEDPNAKDVKWKKQPVPGNKWQVDLMQSIGSNNATGYLRTYVYSPKEQEVIFQCGSDDGIKCFLNGKVFHAANVLRSGAIGTDKVKVKLAKDWSVLMLKVTNNGGGWVANARFRSMKGLEVEGMKVTSKKPK